MGVLLLALGGLLLLGGAPALATAPVPGPVVPYGGQLGQSEDAGLFSDERVLEVSMLALGTVNGLAFAGALLISRFRGSSAQETRHALMARTGQGRASERRASARRRGGSHGSHGTRRDRTLGEEAREASRLSGVPSRPIPALDPANSGALPTPTPTPMPLPAPIPSPMPAPMPAPGAGPMSATVSVRSPGSRR